jgi:hypothetical protein
VTRVVEMDVSEVCMYHDSMTPRSCQQKATMVIKHPRFTYDFRVCFEHGRAYIRALEQAGFTQVCSEPIR